MRRLLFVSVLVLSLLLAAPLPPAAAGGSFAFTGTVTANPALSFGVVVGGSRVGSWALAGEASTGERVALSGRFDGTCESWTADDVDGTIPPATTVRDGSGSAIGFHLVVTWRPVTGVAAVLDAHLVPDATAGHSCSSAVGASHFIATGTVTWL